MTAAETRRAGLPGKWPGEPRSSALKIVHGEPTLQQAQARYQQPLGIPGLNFPMIVFYQTGIWS